MYRQNPNPISPFTTKASASSLTVPEYEITGDDRVLILSESGKGALMLSEAKREMLKGFMKSKKGFIDDATNIDNEKGTQLVQRLDELIPDQKNIVNKLSNQQLAMKIVDLHEVCQVLVSEATTNHRTTRNNPKVRVMSKLDEIISLVDNRVIENVENINLDPLLKGETLSAIQKERQFENSRIPEMDECKKCPFCKHHAVNEPVENDKVIEKNTESLQKHERVMQVWESYEDEKKKKRNENIKKPMHPFTKKVMSRMPRRPVLSSHILQCHCAQSHCIQEGSNNGSNCPIECFNKETLQRYAFEDGRCTCPYCACTCSKAYKVADIPKIVLKLAKVEHVKKKNSSRSCDKRFYF